MEYPHSFKDFLLRVDTESWNIWNQCFSLWTKLSACETPNCSLPNPNRKHFPMYFYLTDEYNQIFSQSITKFFHMFAIRNKILNQSNQAISIKVSHVVLSMFLTQL